MLLASTLYSHSLSGTLQGTARHMACCACTLLGLRHSAQAGNCLISCSTSTCLAFVPLEVHDLGAADEGPARIHLHLVHLPMHNSQRGCSKTMMPVHSVQRRHSRVPKLQKISGACTDEPPEPLTCSC